MNGAARHPGLVRRILFALTDRLPARAIRGEDGNPYLERYHLFSLPFGLGAAYIPRFVGSDPDRGLHDHPFGPSLSVILAGGYEELRLVRFTPRELRQRRRRLSAPGFNWVGARTFHRIVLRDDADAWTVFIHGPRHGRGWGFLTSVGSPHGNLLGSEDPAMAGAFTKMQTVFTPFTQSPAPGWHRAAARGRDLRATGELRAAS